MIDCPEAFRSLVEQTHNKQKKEIHLMRSELNRMEREIESNARLLDEITFEQKDGR